MSQAVDQEPWSATRLAEVRAEILAHAERGEHEQAYRAASGTDPLLSAIGERLRGVTEDARGSDREAALHAELADCARWLGRTWDAVAERAYQRAIELEPARWQCHYGYGLFLKTRGRFVEGVAANRRAAELGGGSNEAVQWNYGICATGARDGQLALEVFRAAVDTSLELGRFGLPERRYGTVKVRLAQRPLAQRSADLDDAGFEETVWIERLSPCHGVVRSVLYQVPRSRRRLRRRGAIRRRAHQSSVGRECEGSGADGVVLAARALDVDRERGGGLDFWVDAIKLRLRAGGAYALQSERPIKTAHGLEGRQLRYGREEKQKPYQYWVTLFVDGDRLAVVEAGGPEAQFVTYEKEIDSAVRSTTP